MSSFVSSQSIKLPAGATFSGHIKQAPQKPGRKADNIFDFNPESSSTVEAIPSLNIKGNPAQMTNATQHRLQSSPKTTAHIQRPKASKRPSKGVKNKRFINAGALGNLNHPNASAVSKASSKQPNQKYQLMPGDKLTGSASTQQIILGTQPEVTLGIYTPGNPPLFLGT